MAITHSLYKHRKRQLLPAFFLAALVSFSPAGADDWRFDDVDRIVAISDVHGDYDAMVSTLRNAGVLNDELAWSAGDDHLVITGDLLDRGPDSRKVMDLVRALEPLAAADGGAVHLLLGNHEVMNLVGDLRYVSAAEYAAFAEDELPAERERWYRHHLEQQTLVMDAAADREAWEDRHPPGFFGHRRAFRSDGEYGKWLLQKPLIVVINGTAFVHGGLSPNLADLGLDGVNAKLKNELVEYVRQVELLIDAALLDPAENFHRHAAVLEALPASSSRPASVNAAIESVIELNTSDIHAPDSPLWYRGNVGCGALIETDKIAPALAALAATRVVIGHTPTLTRQVLSRLGGRVVEIDTGMLEAYYEGSGNALSIVGDSLTVIGEQDGSVVAVETHPRRVGRRDPSISAARLQEILQSGEIRRVTEAGRGATVVSVQFEGESVNATFAQNPRGRRFVPELAAYRLDRFLGLGMVPVTVSREFDGRSGVVQFLPDAIMNETERNEARRGGSAWCPLGEQWNAMYVFDALIHNPGRAQDHMIYSQDNWQLMLTGHGRSFENKRSKPAYLENVPLNVGSSWRERLGALTDEVIREQFSDTLDERRRRALSRRRDLLLQEGEGR